MTTRRESAAAIVLAAGYASRMGRPKALLPLGGATVLRCVIETCLRAGVAPVHVVTGHRATLVEGESEAAGAVPVRNDRYPEGQLSSVQAGFRSLPGDVQAVLLFPVDHPLVTEDVLRSLLRAFGEESAGARIFIPTFDGKRGRPYLVDVSLSTEYLALGPGRTGRDVVDADSSRIREVPVREASILIDLDTPDDYVRVRMQYGARRDAASRGDESLG